MSACPMRTRSAGVADGIEQRTADRPMIGVVPARAAPAVAVVDRQHHLGPVSPVRFIPIAEETGLIAPMGRWVIREACWQLAEWRAAGLAMQRVAVNVSPRQRPRLALKDRIAAAGLDYIDPPYRRFKGDKYDQETFFIADPNNNILEIKTMVNPEVLFE